jgi:arylsulfatase A-like enzyme
MNKIIPALCFCIMQLANATEKPNILIILADDLGYGELGSYGSTEISTPNLDKLAEKGIRFTSFYANAPQCTPTRAALLSGKYQQRIGGLECAIGTGNVGRYDEAEWLASKDQLGLPSEFSVLTKELKSAGYNTANIGKWHLGYEKHFTPNNHFFDYSLGPIGYGGDFFYHIEQDNLNLEGFTGNHTLAMNGKEIFRDGYYATHLFTDEAKSWINRQKSEIPFFLYLSYTAPHFPYQGPDDFLARPLSNPEFNRFNQEVYNNMIFEMDRGIGEILDLLKRKNMDENTLVIFFSDNGGTMKADNGILRGHKGQLFEGGIRVPCIISWPSNFPQNMVSSQVTMGFDLTYSALEAASVEVGKLQLDGFDIVNHIKNDKNDIDRELFWRFKRDANVSKAVRSGEYKFIVEYNNDKETERYLFNLKNDISETENLIEKNPKKAQELYKKILEWEANVKAPRLAEFKK